MSEILIEAKNIKKVYDYDIGLKRGINQKVLDNVNFVLEKGDFISIMGPSGSGKSTLLHCLSLLDEITNGDIWIKGKSRSKMWKKELCEFRYKTLGFVFQDFNLIPYLSMSDNIATPALLGNQNEKDVQDKILKLSQQLDIENILDKYPNECSGGECQRVALARALINDPEILFCDEPTGNLDSKNSYKILSILKKLNQEGIAILLVTHDPAVASFSKTMNYLYDGKIKTVVNKNQSSQIAFYQKINDIVVKNSSA